MSIRDRLIAMGLDADGPLATRRRLRDYARAGKRLLVQRLFIYSAAFILTAYFYSAKNALLFYILILVAEAYDAMVFTKILKTRIVDPRSQRRFKKKILVGTLLSSSTVALFNLSIAVQQGQTTHFMPLFLLFSASIFAAMNNHQFLSILSARLAIYMVTLLIIPLRDLIMAEPDIGSELWLQFYTVLFVLAFIFECSRTFILFYVKNLKYIRALEQERNNAKLAYQVKSEFVSTVSHELRTPLTSIKGSLQLIESGKLGNMPETMKSLFEVAVRNSERLAELISDILDLQKAEAGCMNYSFAPVDLGMLLPDTVERMKPYAKKYGVHIALAVEASDGLVWADRKRLDQVFSNIISNAIKFSYEHGEVRVSLTVHEGKLRISVRDNGYGIPSNAREKVFEKFSQIDSSDTRQKGGTGLGMSISKLIVEAHDGSIDFESSEGDGTIFFVDLDPITSERVAS